MIGPNWLSERLQLDIDLPPVHSAAQGGYVHQTDMFMRRPRQTAILISTGRSLITR
jgi:hypothetical protein